MPILDVELVGEPPADGDLARRLADAAGVVLKTPPGKTWVRLRFLSDYAENGGGPPAGIRPVFVSVLTADASKDSAEALATAIAEACGRSAENVHILYEPPARGRIAFGGKLAT